MFDQVMLHIIYFNWYLDRIFFTCSLYMPCVLLVLSLMKFCCHVQVFQDTGVYGASASQLLELGVSEFCLCFKTHI